MDALPVPVTRYRGMTLMELMVVVAVVALLLTLALPAYQQQQLRVNRTAAQGEMLRIAALQQHHLLSRRRFMDASALEASGFALDPDVAKHYRYSISLGEEAMPSFALTFTPLGSQLPDGALGLNEQGVSTPAAKWAR